VKLGGESTENTGGTLNFWIKKALSLSISFLGKALLLSVGFYKNIISILHIYIYILYHSLKLFLDYILYLFCFNERRSLRQQHLVSLYFQGSAHGVTCRRKMR
jgi:hypothetical protein